MKVSSNWVKFNDKQNEYEYSMVEKSALSKTDELNAVPIINGRRDYEHALVYLMEIDNKRYYLAPMLFMAKDKPDEVCHPTHFKNAPIYKCDEGQRYKASCHLFFFDQDFIFAGMHHIRTKENAEVFCNAVPAVGAADKKKNELLVTIQYFPIDRKPASKVTELGDSWIRMTSLFRLKVVDGNIEIETDESCLKNPNRIDTIPDARRVLKTCAVK